MSRITDKATVHESKTDSIDLTQGTPNLSTPAAPERRGKANTTDNFTAKTGDETAANKATLFNSAGFGRFAKDANQLLKAAGGAIATVVGEVKNVADGINPREHLGKDFTTSLIGMMMDHAKGAEVVSGVDEEMPAQQAPQIGLNRLMATMGLVADNAGLLGTQDDVDFTKAAIAAMLPDDEKIS